MWKFTVTLDDDNAADARLHSGARPPIRVDFPTDFGGRAEAWCPEGLLAAAVGSCLMTTFRYHLQRRKGAIRSYMSAIEATLGKTPAGLRITALTVSTVIGLEGERNYRAARQAAAAAEKHCPISHSLNCPVEVTWQIHDTAPEPSAQSLNSGPNPPTDG